MESEKREEGSMRGFIRKAPRFTLSFLLLITHYAGGAQPPSKILLAAKHACYAKLSWIGFIRQCRQQLEHSCDEVDVGLHAC